MDPIYYFIVIIVSAAALIGTLFIAKEMTKKEKEAPSEEDLESFKNDGQNSSIPLLSIIYSITFVISVILIGIYIF